MPYEIKKTTTTHTPKKQTEEAENSTEPDAKLLPTFHDFQIHQKEELAQA